MKRGHSLSLCWFISIITTKNILVMSTEIAIIFPNFSICSFRWNVISSLIRFVEITWNARFYYAAHQCIRTIFRLLRIKCSHLFFPNIYQYYWQPTNPPFICIQFYQQFFHVHQWIWNEVLFKRQTYPLIYFYIIFFSLRFFYTTIFEMEYKQTKKVCNNNNNNKHVRTMQWFVKTTRITIKMHTSLNWVHLTSDRQK